MFHFTTCGTLVVATLFAAGLLGGTAGAVTVPFTEDFTDSAAGWANFNSSAFLTHVVAGGPDDGAYASGPRSFQGLTAGNVTVILRGRPDDPFNASGHAFVGDWSSEDVRRVSAFVRHDAPLPLTYFFRAAATANFPGHIYASPDTVPPGEWTELVFDVTPGSSQLASPEGSDWNTVFSNIGHVQFGVYVPAELVDDATNYTFDLDKVAVAVPEPASLFLSAMSLAAAALVSNRRRARRA